MHDAAGIGPPDALKGACPVRAGAGGKPPAERQKWAPSFDQHSGLYNMPDNHLCDFVSQCLPLMTPFRAMLLTR
jgi:hypothetical protein